MTDHDRDRAGLETAKLRFAGRLGGNQEFIVDRDDPNNAALLRNAPDAAPLMTLKQSFDLRGFGELGIWKAALMEGMGEKSMPLDRRAALLLLVYLTVWISISPDTLAPPPTGAAGVFGTVSFLGPVVGAVSNVLIISLLIYCFAGVSGGHFNPLVTIGTFFARLTTLPRATLYVAFQTAGAAIAGLAIRASYDSRNFKAGGCFLFTDLVSVGSAFMIEFMACLTLLFLAFGVGLDPRQREVIGPTLAPILVGLSLGVVNLGTAFGRRGFGGAAVNPARCFGVFVGSSFPGWHWVHWVATVAASILHGVFYFLVPPWHMTKAPSQTSMTSSRSAA